MLRGDCGRVRDDGVVPAELDLGLEPILERGQPELVSQDDRFAYAFTSFALSYLPVRVWHFDHGRLVDVTRRFPAQVGRDADGLREQYEKLRREELIPLGSRIRTRLATEHASRDELAACLNHLLAGAGNASLKTPQLRQTPCEPAPGNSPLNLLPPSGPVHRLPCGKCAAHASSTARNRRAPWSNIFCLCRSSRPLCANCNSTLCDN